MLIVLMGICGMPVILSMILWYHVFLKYNINLWSFLDESDKQDILVQKIRKYGTKYYIYTMLIAYIFMIDCFDINEIQSRELIFGVSLIVILTVAYFIVIIFTRNLIRDCKDFEFFRNSQEATSKLLKVLYYWMAISIPIMIIYSIYLVIKFGI